MLHASESRHVMSIMAVASDSACEEGSLGVFLARLVVLFGERSRLECAFRQLDVLSAAL